MAPERHGPNGGRRSLTLSQGQPIMLSLDEGSLPSAKIKVITTPIYKTETIALQLQPYRPPQLAVQSLDFEATGGIVKQQLC
ncbi:hypothetical protein T265_03275 [Opisthorchis viverrini]|uniref:Uncharacterized protein n=1 Tax=Opisthorchis viverrini TaxID=6198 RepID=A0A074ZT88_OPIVI|nr:hypothetical protein T265_03275 [Opisthorchis viverrini]KER30331.1 hypothetical protein T265_03275 [Opisthorchis viverrini]